MNAATFDNQPILTFAQSESKAVGMGGSAIQLLRDNAVSIVGLIQVAGAMTLLFDDSLLIKAMGAAGIATRGLTAAFGNKQHQQKVLEQEKGDEVKLGNNFTDNIRKAFNPSGYPIEFAAGLSILTTAILIGYGASLELDANPDTHGRSLIAVGAVSLLAYGHLLFGREKSASEQKEDGQSMAFAESTSKAQGWIGHSIEWLKDNPVQTSSIVTGALTAILAIGNVFDGNEILAAAGGLFAVSNIVQAALVRKEEFTLDSAREQFQKERESTRLKSPESFAEREAARRQEPSQPQLGLT